VACIPTIPSLTTSLSTTTTNLTNQKIKITPSGAKGQGIGSTITRGRKDTMALLPNSHNILRKGRNSRYSKNSRKFGCNTILYYRPNFNGTSKNFVETLARPSPPPSQLPLN
jgi:hypothetical protein